MPTPISNMTVTWNNGATVFNAVKMNVTDTASNSTSKLMDYSVGAQSIFTVRKDGYMNLRGTLPRIDIPSDGISSNIGLSIQLTKIIVVSGGGYVFSNNATQIYGGADDTALERQSPAVLKATNAAGGAGLIRLPALTVATLPAAATAGVGARSTVTDALAPTFMATVAAGGAVITPVYSDGTNWKVG